MSAAELHLAKLDATITGLLDALPRLMHERERTKIAVKASQRREKRARKAATK